jgi:hypothetical protein
VKIGPQDSHLHGRIVTQQSLRFFDGDRLEDYHSQQIVGLFHSSCRAEFAQAVEPLDIALVSRHQLFARASLFLPSRPVIQQTERMTPHILGRAGIQLVQPEVFDANSGRCQPGVHVDGIAMRKNRRIRKQKPNEKAGGESKKEKPPDDPAASLDDEL